MPRWGRGKDSEIDLAPYEIVRNVSQNGTGENGTLLHSNNVKPEVSTVQSIVPVH